MRMKRLCAFVLLAALVLCGCGTNLRWKDNVAAVGETYLSRGEFEAWYEDMKSFDAIMPESLCAMLMIDGALRDESALMAFVRYKTICISYAEAGQQDAQALLDELELEHSDVNLSCATVYCTIDAVRKQVTADVTVTKQEVLDWYDAQVEAQSDYAQRDLAGAQEKYMLGEYPVTVYVPEGLRFIQVIGISCEDKEPDKAFSIAQSAWRRLLYGDPFADLFAEYNEETRYDAGDGTPKTFCLYEGWNEDADVARLAENLHAPGQMCGPTICGDVCLIVRYDKQPASGDIAFKLIEDDCRQGALQEKLDQVWRDALDTMHNDCQVRFAPHE